MEVIAPFTTDEMTVLMLMNNTGNTLAAIGRWKKPLISLTERGFVTKFDEVNYGINDAGRIAFSNAQDADLYAYVDSLKKVHLANPLPEAKDE